MFREKFRVTSQREGDILNITENVQEIVGRSRVRDGLVHLFVHHSTAALTMIEYEQGVLSDLARALSVVAPGNEKYAHDTKWGDGNGRSHVKAALVGPDLTLPVEEGKVACGTWQQVVLLELDVNAGRERTVTCTVVGSG